MLIQPVVIYGTAVHMAIEPVIQPVANYGTAVQTVNILRVLNLEPLSLNSLYGCTIKHSGLYNGLYGHMHGCTINHNRLYRLF